MERLFFQVFGNECNSWKDIFHITCFTSIMLQCKELLKQIIIFTIFSLKQYLNQFLEDYFQ